MRLSCLYLARPFFIAGPLVTILGNTKTLPETDVFNADTEPLSRRKNVFSSANNVFLKGCCAAARTGVHWRAYRGVTAGSRWCMARILLVFTVLLGLFGAFGVSSQTQPTQPQDRPVIRTTTREVVLDLVVRDKHHHAVTDLRPEEIEVFEDGVKQNVR